MTSPLALTKPEASTSTFRTVALASLGGALEFYDFVIFVYFAVVIGQLFFPPSQPEWLRQLQTFGIFAAGYLARPLGGAILSHFGDKSGRKRIFTLSVLMMALPTLCIGLLPSYGNAGVAAPLLLLLMRILQGAAIGGEAPGGWVFVAEHAPSNQRGLAVGLLTSGLNGGILLGSLVAALTNSYFSTIQIMNGIWRLPFLIGGMLGLIAMLMRRWLSETPVFEELRKQVMIPAEIPLREALRAHKRAIVLSMVSTWALTAAIIVVILMTPVILQTTFSLPVSAVHFANLAAILALCTSSITVGAATDHFGLERVAVPMYTFLIVASLALYLGVIWKPWSLLPLYILAGLAAGCVTITPILMTRMFPAALRFSGISFSYNVTYAVAGGVSPLLVSWLAHLHRMGPAIYVALSAVLGIIAVRFRRDEEA